MANKFLLISVQLLIYSIAFSQIEDRKGYVGLLIGPSFPNGVYGSTDLMNNEAGYATTGVMYEASLAYKLGKYLGIDLMIHLQNNSIDEQALEKQLEFTIPNSSWSVSSSSWATGGVLGGLYCSFPFGENSNSNFEMRLLLGYTSTSTPDAVFKSVNGANNVTVEQTSSSSGAFTYLIGAGYRLNLSASTGLLINVDYLSTSPHFDNVTTYLSTNGYLQNTTHNSFDQPVSTVNLSIGIAFRIR